MIHKPISRRWRIGLGVASVSVFCLAYLSLAHRQHAINPLDTTLPTASQLADGLELVFTASERTGNETWFWIDLRATFLRLFTGLGLGVVASIVLGLLMGCYAPVEAALLPPLAFLAKIPPTAMLAVFFVLVGVDFAMYVSMIAFGVLPTLTQAVYEAAKKDVPDELIDKASTLGASQPEVIWDVIFKHILPKVLEAVRLQVGPAMVYLIAAEWMNGSVGFGYRFRSQSRLLNMSVVYVYLIFLGMAGYAMDQALIRARRKLCPWYGE